MCGRGDQSEGEGKPRQRSVQQIERLTNPKSQRSAPHSGLGTGTPTIAQMEYYLRPAPLAMEWIGGREDYLCHPLLTVKLTHGTLFVFTPIDDLHFCHEAHFCDEAIRAFSPESYR